MTRGNRGIKDFLPVHVFGVKAAVAEKKLFKIGVGSVVDNVVSWWQRGVVVPPAPAACSSALVKASGENLILQRTPSNFKRSVSVSCCCCLQMSNSFILKD